MRILSVSPYYEGEGGGLERYAHAMNRRLAARGHTVTAVAFGNETGTRIQDGVAIELSGPMLRLGNTPIHPAFAVTVAKAIRTHRPDVVVAHTPVPFPAEMAYLAASHANVPFVTVYHAGSLRGSTPILAAFAALDRNTLERRMLGGSAHLVAVTSYVRDHALVRHRDKVSIIAPGVDADRFTAPTTPGQGFLFVAPLDSSYAWKGLDVLLEAFDQVRKTDPDATLTLVGQGNRQDEMAKQAEATEGAIRLAGRLSEQDLTRALQSHAATILPSTTDSESFGMVLAEANAAGRPVIGSNIGGIPHFVHHGHNGLLAEAGNPHDLARQMRRILHEPSFANDMGLRGRERVLKEHDWDRLALRFEQVLADVVKKDEAHCVVPMPVAK